MFQRAITGSTWTDLTFAKRWTGTAWVDVSFVRRWDGAAWITVWPVASDLRAEVSSPTALGVYGCTHTGVGDNFCPFVQNITSETVTVSSSGGTGAGPAYAWSFVSGDSGITVNSPTGTTVSFSGVVGRRQSKTAVWRCTVTRGTESRFIDVVVILTYNYTFDGEIIP